VQNTIYKTAHLKDFTDCWMYPVSFFASIFPYSKQKSTYTCRLCEVHSVLEEKSCQYKQLFRCSTRTFAPTVLAPQQLSCQGATSLHHNKHCRANTSAAIEHESHTRNGYKRDKNPDAEFSKFKNVGTLKWMILTLLNNSQCASNEIITRRASQQDLNRGKGCELA